MTEKLNHEVLRMALLVAGHMLTGADPSERQRLAGEYLGLALLAYSTPGAIDDDDFFDVLEEVWLALRTAPALSADAYDAALRRGLAMSADNQGSVQ